ncbi:MAG: hypothetical protein J2P26_04695, partial [Nocardiopsaceae bacterium]|nr:hypothetical protein [Nocardiopsaceae bacterium]
MGAALRFPGAADPASFHELVISGQRTFRDGPRLAALLDGGAGPPVAGGRVAGAVGARAAGTGAADAGANHRIRPYAGWFPGSRGPRRGSHPLAAETAAAALADVPEAGRSRAGRIGVIIADLPAPGLPDVTSWVAGQLGLAPGQEVPPQVCSLRAVAAACELLTTGRYDLVLAGGVSDGLDPAWLAYRAG